MPEHFCYVLILSLLIPGNHQIIVRLLLYGIKPQMFGLELIDILPVAL